MKKYACICGAKQFILYHKEGNVLAECSKCKNKTKIIIELVCNQISTSFSLIPLEDRK